MSAVARDATGSFHVPSLDGMRAIAFGIVFAAHAGLDRIVPGGFGVTVFFFLSGYLITTLLRIEHDEHGTVSMRQFYLRRAFRILPPFYLVLAMSILAAATGVVGGGFQGRAVAGQALHFANYWIVRHGYGGLPSGTGVYWSLAVEEHFYLVFPWLYIALRHFVAKPRTQAVVLWVLCGVVLAWRCVLVYAMHAPSDRTYVASDTRIDSILFGCALGIYGNPMLDGASKISELAWKRLLLPLAIAILLASFLFRDPGFRETFRYSAQGVALYPIFIAAVRFPKWSLFRWLNTRAAAFGGVLSYVLYLVHHVVLDALGGPLAGHAFVRAALALSISVALAWGIHRSVEMPCAKLRKRISRLLARPTMHAPALLGTEPP